MYPKYQKTIKIKILGTEYEVSYPNVGEQLDIENMKNLLTNGRYAEIAKTGSKTATQLLDLVDAVSYFSVLIPPLREILSITKYQEIGAREQMQLGRSFRKFYNEFIMKVEEEINKELDSEENEYSTGANQSGL